MTEFKSGDRVKMKCYYNDKNAHRKEGKYAHGQVTIVTEYSCKVLFDEDWAPKYWYYLKEDLELDNG